MEKTSINMPEGGMKGHILEKIPYFLLVALVFLLPVFFIPSSLVSFSYNKIILISIVILLSLFAWTILSFKSGKLILPWNWFSLSAVAIPFILLLAALFSPNRTNSLIGGGFELGTFSFVLLMVILMFMISIFARSREKIFYCYLWFGGAFLLVAIYQILHLFMGPDFLSFNYFTDVTSNTIGKWNDVAVFSGIAVILSLVSLELLVLGRLFKTLFYLVLILALFLLAVINFTVIWSTPFTIVTLVGVFALIFFVYFISSNQATSQENNSDAPSNDPVVSDVNVRSSRSTIRKIPIPSLVVLVFAVVFTLAATPVNNYLGSALRINNLDVVPTWQSTFAVAKGSLSHNALLGVGPNRFSDQWLLSKPDGVNQSDFWNTDFNYGVGFIPTFLVTSGLLGILAWLIFLGLFVYFGVKIIFAKIKDKFSFYLIFSSFFTALYLWIMHILYVPSTVTLAFAFIFTGFFLGSLFREGILREKSISYVHDSRKGFASVMLLVLILIAIIAWGYLISNKVVAAAYGNKSAIALNAGDISGAETNILKAINSDKDPGYYRFLSQIELSRMNSLLGQKDANTDVVKNQFQSLLDNATGAASAAVASDNTDYQNWLSLGLVYEAVVPLGVQNAVTQAENAYQEALKRNPKNPSIYLLLARLEATAKNTDKAKEYITDALKLKTNYLDAIYLLAQMELSEGDSQSAVSSLENATTIVPNDGSVWFQLGSLNYNLGNYDSAATAFKQSLFLIPDYADAKYYLGLSLAKLGETDAAVSQFQDLLTSNSDGQNAGTLSAIIANIKAGRDPLANLGQSNSTSAQSDANTLNTANSTTTKK